MRSDEEILKPDKIGLYDKDGQEVRNWTPPTPHRLQFKKRVFEIEQWVSRNGLLTKDEVVAYVQVRWNVNRPRALEYVEEVINDFQRSGHAFGEQVDAKRRE